MHHAVEKAIPHNKKNFPLSRPFSMSFSLILRSLMLRIDKEEEEETPEPEHEEEEVVAHDNEMKTSRDGAPRNSSHLEDLQVHEDHDVNMAHSSDKQAATLQPDDSKLHFAAKAATSGDSHDPKSGLEKHEASKKGGGDSSEAKKESNQEDKKADKKDEADKKEDKK